MTLQEHKNNFLIKAQVVHGNKYCYDFINYINSRTKINISCPEHGLFKQTPSNHLNGQNCPVCSNRGRSNNNRFISSAVLIHGDRYDYSLVEYANSKSQISVLCREHGIFKQTPTRHLCGDGCPKCNGGVKLDGDEFINRATIKHENKYDYSLIQYVNSQTKVKIICSEHGIFKMRPNNHLSGQGCGKCDLKNKTLTTNEFIVKAEKIHNNIYDYSQVDYKHNNMPINIICKKHGVFKQKPNSHLNGRGCSKCKIKSKGELLILNWFKNNSITFEVQKTFDDCKNILPLKFDFYVPKQNLLIEYDGEPHFKEVNYLGGRRGFQLRQKNDNIKNEYCMNNGINLLRITYLEIKKISFILENNIIINN